jgi:hypothetical protein
MLAAKGITDPDKKAARELWDSVNSSLVNHKGDTVKRVGEGMPARWAIT